MILVMIGEAHRAQIWDTFSSVEEAETAIAKWREESTGQEWAERKTFFVYERPEEVAHFLEAAKFSESCFQNMVKETFTKTTDGRD